MRKILENLYTKYSKREFVHPDPLEFLYEYSTHHDREVVALVASSLAYGRVAQILKSVSDVLSRMGPSPHKFLMSNSDKVISKKFDGFKHRFTSGFELAQLLIGAKGAIERHGSLNECFVRGLDPESETILPALSKFVSELGGGAKWSKGLLPSPEMGSACKRLNLFLRWMVRRDIVDPGGWKGVSPSKLIVPLDTHMHRLGRELGFTKRNAADLRTAVEITKALSIFSPRDPVKYDFALTRLGIRTDTDMDAFLKKVKTRPCCTKALAKRR